MAGPYSTAYSFAFDIVDRIYYPPCQETTVVVQRDCSSGSRLATSLALSLYEHDDSRFSFEFENEGGGGVLWDDFTDLDFIVSPSVNQPATLTKSKSLGTFIQGTDTSGYFIVNDVDSLLFGPGNHYCELRGLLNGGVSLTLATGSFLVANTNIGDY